MGLSVLALIGSAAAQAQLQSSRPIRLVVPFAPGGGSDISARLIGQKMAEILGVSVVVDNRPGASGVVGTEIVKRSTADGHTLVLIDTAHTVNKILLPSTPYDPITDFSAISLVATAPMALVVHPSVPAQSAQDFVNLARKDGVKVTMGSAGAGTSSHLAGELLRLVANVQWTHVPYRGTGPALAELVGGQLQAFIGPLPASIALVKSGKLKALAVASESRAKLLPNVPTLAEQGVTGVIASNWYGILGPANIPAATVATLNASVAKGVVMPDTQERFVGLGLEPRSSPAAELTALLHEETKKWRHVIATAKIKVD
jgi:tripartite-type tricarboxylate transporter receptor subunit TctC